MSPEVRVLLLSHKYPPSMGGVQLYAREIARALVDAGHEVTVWTSTAEAWEVQSGDSRIPVRRFRARAPTQIPHYSMPGMVWAAVVSSDARRADVVHAIGYTFAVASIAWMIRTLWRTRMSLAPVLTVHPKGSGRRLYDRFVGKRVIAAADVLLPHSDRELGELKRRGFRWRQARVVPYGIDPAFAENVPDAPEWVSRYRLDGDGPLILFVGRLVRAKGCDDLLQAMVELRREVPRARAIVMGGPEELLPAYRAQADRLGLGETINFAGIVADPREKVWLYSKATVVTLPSEHEQFGIVALEAAAAGRPLAVTDVGILSEVALGWEIGLVHRFGDPAGLATNLTRLIREPEFRARAEARREEVIERYSWPRVGRETVDVLEALVT